MSILLLSSIEKKGLSNNLKNDTILDKINFDISLISRDGLIGPPDGLRSVSYEFCIPAINEAVKTIQTIDTQIDIYRQSPGRIGCRKNQYLCIAHTHNKQWKDILFSIAGLDYVEEIGRFFGE
ncbi:MAG: hypothetical protein AB4062_05650 [Crocosphaera sp.]